MPATRLLHHQRKSPDEHQGRDMAKGGKVDAKKGPRDVVDIRWAVGECAFLYSLFYLQTLFTRKIASAPEKGEELPLEELGSALGSGFSGALGKYSTGLISRLMGGKMPGGFNSSAIKSYLSKSWGLGSSRSDGVLLLGTTLEPPKRLASADELMRKQTFGVHFQSKAVKSFMQRQCQ